MDKRLQSSLAAALLLAGSGAYLYLKGGAPSQQDALQVAQQRSELEHCLHAAQMVFDVHWAAACTTQGDGDDSAECDLPDAKAAVVNTWLNEAEKRCMAEARAAP
ncbi:MAG: hypothetical protein Q8R01_15475 [Ramlibacter sp.]|nr:hypothetical protein [Ramlibacter sp.]